MREYILDAWERRKRGVFLAGALLVFGAYCVLGGINLFGASVAGQGPDPVWAAAKQRGTLRVAVEFGYYPFVLLEAGKPAGYDVDLINAVAEKMGLRVEFVSTGLDSIYDDLAYHRVDVGASALPYAPEQGWRAGFSTFYFNAGQVLVVAENSTIASQQDLADHTVGAQLGSAADTYLRGLANGDKRITLHSNYDTATDVLAAVRRGELDAAVVDNVSALLDLGHTPGLKSVGPALTLEPFILAVPADAYQLREQINRSLEQLRQEGFFEKTGKKWFVDMPIPQR